MRKLRHKEVKWSKNTQLDPGQSGSRISAVNHAAPMTYCCTLWVFPPQCEKQTQEKLDKISKLPPTLGQQKTG